ncbi:hypothetical protein OC25_15250 [Pedobacter kyungheensis]|uniref:Uncharacterized protein n=1 Tax=Pedobacter kyungheensis TaxID=1069985 RepID=A0A0C1DFQ0_9SPHI|nr:hypothetical protein [Pedobacter kyungheensis]KIA92750.1 hypothetical protein OC25_15250 [Pedobacter kyungheensis]
MKTLGYVKTAGKYLGAAGQVLNTGVYLNKAFSSKEHLTTGDHVGFWAGTGVFAAAMMFINPVTAGITLGYGALELGSWLYNGKSIEQNIFDK